MSLGPISTLIGTPFISYSANFHPGEFSEASISLTLQPFCIKISIAFNGNFFVNDHFKMVVFETVSSIFSIFEANLSKKLKASSLGSSSSPNGKILVQAIEVLKH